MRERRRSSTAADISRRAPFLFLQAVDSAHEFVGIERAPRFPRMPVAACHLPKMKFRTCQPSGVQNFIVIVRSGCCADHGIQYHDDHHLDLLCIACLFRARGWHAWNLARRRAGSAPNQCTGSGRRIIRWRLAYIHYRLTPCPTRMNRHPLAAALLWVAPLPVYAADMANNGALVARAQQRWKRSVDGAWLSRTLPPNTTPERLPEPESRGARLLPRCCVQCHHLPSPAMHRAAKWPRIFGRMALRMKGHGNMGALMSDMMGGVAAPSEEETHALLACLQQQTQQPIEARPYPDLAGTGRISREACSQCHEPFDPASRAPGKWREIVEQMSCDLQRMNRVGGSRLEPCEPHIAVEQIVGYLERNASRGRAAAAQSAWNGGPCPSMPAKPYELAMLPSPSDTQRMRRAARLAVAYAQQAPPRLPHQAPRRPA